VFRLYTAPLYLNGFIPYSYFSMIFISNVMFGFSCNELALYCYQMYHIHIYFSLAELFLFHIFL